MEDSVSTSLPSILWRIENYTTCERKVHSLSFLGLSWKLIFSPIVDSGTKKIMFRLECLNARENSHPLQLYSYSCILLILARSEILPVKTAMSMADKEWCVWLYSIGAIQQQTGTAAANDISFSLKIFPAEPTKENIMFLEQIRTQDKKKKVSCATILIQDFSTLYNNSEHSDFEIRCKELKMPVHKAILSARSGYFAALFRSHMEEADKGFVELHDIELDTLQHVIHYLYSGKLPELPRDTVLEVYAIADRFDIESLRVKCASLVMVDFMKEQVTPDVIKEQQPDTENETLNQEMEKLHISCDDTKNTLLKQLFTSFEWKILSKENPALAEKMCKPIFLDIPKI